MATDQEFFEKFYSVLTNKIGKGIYSTPGFGAGALVFNSPGVIIDPAADWNVPAVRDRFSAIVDFVVDPSYVSGNAYGTNYTRISDLYQGVLTFRNYAQTPLSEAEQKALQAAKDKLLVGPEYIADTPLYAHYKELLHAAHLAQIGYNALASTPNPDPLELAERSLAFKEASKAATQFDHVHSLTQADNDLKRLAWRDGSGYWQELDDRAEAYRVSDTNALGLAGTLFKTDFYPTIASLLVPTTKWTKIGITEAEITASKKTKATSWSVSGGAGAFGWGGRASYSELTKRIDEDNEVTGFGVELEYTSVFILRPWMDVGMFYSRAWDWDDSTTPWLEDTYHKGMISNGAKIGLGQQPDGISPWIPVGLIVAKNTKFTGHWKKDIYKWYEKHVSASAGASYWGFSIGGNYSMDETSEFKNSKLTDSSMEFADPQIIAMICIPLPLSPNWDEEKYGPKPSETKVLKVASLAEILCLTRCAPLSSLS